MNKRGEPKSNNQTRILVHSFENLGSRGLRALLGRTDIRLINKAVRVFGAAYADAQYSMNAKLLQLSRQRRSKSAPRRRRRSVPAPRSSTFPGVYFIRERNKWGARYTQKNGERKYIGAFLTETEAIQALRKVNKNGNSGTGQKRSR